MSKETGLTEQHKAQALKQTLLDCLKEQNAALVVAAQAFFDNPKKNQEDKIELLKTIIASANHLIAAGDWESSLFLRNQLKKIKAAKAEAESELQKLSGDQSQDHLAVDESISEDEMLAYIVLFQSDGFNMAKWAVQLRSLSDYVVGRPVYANEADVQKRIRLRATPSNEAYVVVAVNKSDSLADTEFSSKDQFDYELLSLKESALKRGRIIVFVHQNQRYHFIDGQLVKLPE